MKEFVKMTGAVALGTLLASGVAMKLVTNKKFLKKYVYNVMKLGEEIANEVTENDFED